MAELAGVGQYKTVDPEFTAVKQYNAQTLATAAKNAAPGQTAEEYLASRGGVNAAGYYGDSWNAKQNLSDAQYSKVIAEAKAAGKTGTALGSAVNAATAKLRYDSAIASGVDPIKAAADYNASITESNAANNQNVPLMKDSSGNVIDSATKNSVTVANTSDVTNASTNATGLKTDAQIAAETAAATAKGERQSAYDLLYQQFNQYGLGALVTPLKDLITGGASPSEFTIRLRETDAYKKRFAANADRIAKGLTAISEAEYLGLEDQYQNIMRNYGLPAEYYTRGNMGIQEGFNKFIANDVSATELEDRVLTAQSRVMNANPEVLASLKAFYPDITNGDILAYTLDPTKALTDIKRKVTAAEIGGAATQAGLGLTGTRAAELGAAGITKEQAQQGFQTVAEVAPRGGQLAAMYGESPYTQQTAEQEVFGLAGSTEAAKQRKKLVGLERAAFSGRTGIAQGALGRERAGNI